MFELLTELGVRPDQVACSHERVRLPELPASCRFQQSLLGKSGVRLASGLLGAGECPQVIQCGIKGNGERRLILERPRHEQTTFQCGQCRCGQALWIGIRSQVPRVLESRQCMSQDELPGVEGFLDVWATGLGHTH